MKGIRPNKIIQLESVTLHVVCANSSDSNIPSWKNFYFSAKEAADHFADQNECLGKPIALGALYDKERGKYFIEKQVVKN